MLMPMMTMEVVMMNSRAQTKKMMNTAQMVVVMLLQRRKRDWGRWAHDTTVRILEAVWPLWSRYRFAGPPHSRLVVACAAAALPPRKACSPLGAWLSPPPRRQVGQVGQDHRSHARTPSAFYGVSPPSRPPPRPVCSEGGGGVKVVGGCFVLF